MGGSWQNKDFQNDDFVCFLFKGGYYQILEHIITNLPLKAILTSRMVSSGEWIIDCLQFLKSFSSKML